LNHEFYLADAIEVIDEVLAAGGEFRMYPKGTSMLPLLVQGRDSVILKRKDNIPANKHDIAFYRRDNGQFVLHRVMKIESNGTYVMCGDNQLVLERGIKAEQIIGYVSSFYRKDKKIDTHSVLYSIYVFFHCIMPLRHIAFLACRAARKIKRIFLHSKSNNT